jgi:hypothetical protein
VRFYSHRSSRPQRITYLPEEELQVIEQQVLVLADAAESTRRAAESHATAVEKEVRVRLERGQRTEAPPDAASSSSSATSPVGLPPPAPPAPPPPPPPWFAWLQEREAEDERPPERIIGDVRVALIEALERNPATTPILKPEESMVVAVDFVASQEPFAPPERLRTLVIRVKGQALLDKRKGSLTPEQLRKAMSIEEY